MRARERLTGRERYRKTKNPLVYDTYVYDTSVCPCISLPISMCAPVFYMYAPAPCLYAPALSMYAAAFLFVCHSNTHEYPRDQCVDTSLFSSAGDAFMCRHTH